MARLTLKELHFRIKKLDQRPYGNYRTLQGDWWGDNICYSLLHVQGDPYANPTRIELRAPLSELGFPGFYMGTEESKVATADYVHRLAWAIIQEWPEEIRSEFKIVRPSSVILPRTACYIENTDLIFRLGVQMPGPERRIAAAEAQELLTIRLPELLASLHYSFLNTAALDLHIKTYARYLRIQKTLEEKGWLAFIADGAILPRAGGFDDRPMEDALAFASPDHLAVQIEDQGEILRGMAIPKGLTVITGGAFHGKSTLLQALEMGVYPHIPGDGRELVVTQSTAWKLRVEDGRAIGGTDLSPLLSKLPGKQDVKNFSTLNASGSTSQAANFVEAWEAGARIFLVDEDQSAVNFLFKDDRMRSLVPPSIDPIRHLSTCVREVTNQGISLVLCQGASGDFLIEADVVLRLNHYKVEDITALRDEIFAAQRQENFGLDGKGFAPKAHQLKVWPKGLAGKSLKTKVRGRILQLGEYEIHAELLPQLACNEQLRAIGELMLPWIQSGHPVSPENPEWSVKKIWDRLRTNTAADLALPRPLELWAVLRRWPNLKFE